MSRKDFVIIAQTIARIQGKKARQEAALLFADELANHNPNFKRDRFISACNAVDTRQ